MLRIVCDTHIMLEWLVWGSPKLDALRIAHQNRQIQLLSSDAIAVEWRAVLAYPRLLESRHARYELSDIDAICTAHAKLHHWITVDSELHSETLKKIPQCADSSDQKFLQCAVLGHAQLLLTRDKKIRKILRHRYFRELGLRVADVDFWVPSGG